MTQVLKTKQLIRNRYRQQFVIRLILKYAIYATACEGIYGVLNIRKVFCRVLACRIIAGNVLNHGAFIWSLRMMLIIRFYNNDGLVLGFQLALTGSGIYFRELWIIV